MFSVLREGLKIPSKMDNKKACQFYPSYIYNMYILCISFTVSLPVTYYCLWSTSVWPIRSLISIFFLSLMLFIYLFYVDLNVYIFC